MGNKSYFKVLNAEGKSNHGGDMLYSLPTLNPDGTWTPGDWHTINGAIQICVKGLHLTDKPANWAFKDCRVFLCEYDSKDMLEEKSDAKICVRKARLLEELTGDALWPHGIYTSGSHIVRDGVFFAYGNSTVEAYGNSTVEAYDNSTVQAYGNSTVQAYGNSTVQASDNSTVEAYDNSTVQASDNSTVQAYDNSTVEAYGNSNILFFNGNKVTLENKATAKDYYSNKLYVKKSAFEIIEL